MLYYGWVILKQDVILRNQFYKQIIQEVTRLSNEVRKANITNILMYVLKQYETTGEDDIIDFGKYMPDFFKKDIKKLYKKNGIFFHGLNKNINPIFSL